MRELVTLIPISIYSVFRFLSLVDHERTGHPDSYIYILCVQVSEFS